MNANLPSLLWLVLIPAGLVVLGLFPAMLVSLWERQLVWTFQPVRPEEAYPASEYARSIRQAAEHLGFGYLGAFHHAKGGIYKVRYDFWIAPDGEVLAITGAGTMASIRVKSTRLYTRLTDGRCLLTTDDPASAMEGDLASTTECVLLANADFEELLARHRRRVDDAPLPSVLFGPGDPLGDFRAFRSERIGRLVDLGYGRFVDDAKTTWRYTPRGAIVGSLRRYFKGLGRAVPNETRKGLARPGDPTYVSSRGGGVRTGGVLGAVRMIFFFMMVGGAILTFSRGPAKTPAQASFRLTLGGIGLIGYIATIALKRPARREPVEDED
jgi:hypothetical protein